MFTTLALVGGLATSFVAVICHSSALSDLKRIVGSERPEWLGEKGQLLVKPFGQEVSQLHISEVTACVKRMRFYRALGIGACAVAATAAIILDPPPFLT